MDHHSPGWWPTGDGHERYWDGKGWTDQLRPLGDQRGQTAHTAAAVKATAHAVPSASPNADCVPTKGRRSQRITAFLLTLAVVGAGGYYAGHGSLPSLLAMPSNTEHPAPHATIHPARPAAAKSKPKPKAKAGPPAVHPTSSGPDVSTMAPVTPTKTLSRPVVPVAPRPAPAPDSVTTPSPTSKHTPTAADCSGAVVAVSHVVTTRTTATLSGTITNETGFRVFLAMIPVGVMAWDTNGQNVQLSGYYTVPAGGYLQPGQTIDFHSSTVTMETPGVPWDLDDWKSGPQFPDQSVEDFCNQVVVPSYQVWR